jgi:hypothetical protein
MVVCSRPVDKSAVFDPRLTARFHMDAELVVTVRPDGDTVVVWVPVVSEPCCGLLGRTVPVDYRSGFANSSTRPGTWSTTSTTYPCRR